MKKCLMGLLSCLCILPAFAGGGNPLKGAQAIRQVSSAAVQRALVCATAPVQTLRISNIPGKPAVRFGGQPLSACKARLVAPKKVHQLFFPKSAVGERFSAGKMFVPHGLLGQEKSVYRGMALQLPELKNLLTNGLEIHKSLVHRKVYTALEPVIALTYANPAGCYIAGREKKDTFPVLVKIPFVAELGKYAPHLESDIWQGHLILEQDLPAHFISDVWVFLEVNGQPAWYKAVLQEGELVLLPAPGELRERLDGFIQWGLIGF